MYGTHRPRGLPAKRVRLTSTHERTSGKVRKVLTVEDSPRQAAWMLQKCWCHGGGKTHSMGDCCG